MNSLLVLLVIAFLAVTDFFCSNVELTFSFLLVLRLSLHAVYYLRTRPKWTVIVRVPRCPIFWLTTGFQAAFLFRRPTKLEEGPTLQCVCRRVYIVRWKAENKSFVILKKARWPWSSRTVVRVVYVFITPLRRKGMMIEILNSSSLIVNLSWQSCVGWLSGIWSNLAVHVFCYVLEAK